MLKSDQSIEGNNNNQAGRDINHYGISYADAKEIAMDIYRNELPYLTTLASDKAWKRVEPMLNEILDQIHQKKPEAINEFAEPEVQYMLGSAMKTASATDDSVVHDTLVQLAVEHVLGEERSYKRIIDQQAINVLQKMNRDILRSLQEVAFWNTPCAFVTEDNIIEYISKYSFKLFYPEHLESIGCISVADDIRTVSPRATTRLKSSIGSRNEDIQIRAHRIREIYGMYFHIESSKVKEISNYIFHKEMDENTFNSMIKRTVHDMSRPHYLSDWQDTIVFDLWKLMGYTTNFNDMVFLMKNEHLFRKFISQVFYSEDEIYGIMRSNDPLIPFSRPFIDRDILDYALTPVGYALQKFLPPLLEKDAPFPSFNF